MKLNKYAILVLVILAAFALPQAAQAQACEQPGPATDPAPANGQVVKDIYAFGCITPDITANACGGTCSKQKDIPTDQCTKSITVTRWDIDDEGTVSVGGNTIASHQSCTCDCNAQSGTNCAASIGLGNAVAFTRGSPATITTTARNDCKARGTGTWGATRVYVNLKRVQCNTGYACDASSGSVQCVATSEQPILGVLPTSLSFNCQQGTAPSAQILTVGNTGGGTLSWTGSITSGGSWLGINQTSGSIPGLSGQNITVSITNSCQLSPTTYSGNIKISTPDGTDFKNIPVSLAVAASPPNVTCSASPNPAQANQLVTFTANPQGGTGSYSYLWSGAVSGSTQSVSTSFATAGTKTANIQVTDSANQQAQNSCSVSVCSGAITGVSPASFETYIGQDPKSSAVSWSTTGCPQATLCRDGALLTSGTSGSFTDNNILCGAPATARTYTYTLHSGNTCGGAQISSSTAQITCYNDLGNVLCSPTPAETYAGSPVTFSASSTGGKQPVSYAWLGGGTGSTKSVTCPAGTQSTISQSVTATDALGTSKTSAQCSATCYAGFTVSCSSPATAPSGSSVTFTASSSGGKQPASYAWSGGGTGSTKTVVCTGPSVAQTVTGTDGLGTGRQATCTTACNSAPILNSVAAACARTSSATTVTSVASDPDANSILLECGSSSGTSNLCTGSYAASNPACTIAAGALPAGTTTIYCRARDTSSAASSEKTATVSKDDTAPTFNALAITPTPAGTLDTVTLAGSANDNLCGVSSYKIYVDGVLKCSGASSCSTPGQQYAAGDRSVQEEATDAAGNTATRASTFNVKTGPVSITSISISPNPADSGSAVTLSCGSSVANVNCINGALAGNPCLFQSWSGSSALFTCTASNTCPATQTATCSVDAAKCKAGATPSLSTTLNVQCSVCGGYASSTTCNADSRCEWIYPEGSASAPNACSYPADPAKRAPPKYYNSGTGVCLPKGTASYSCTANKCGAACDANIGCSLREGCSADVNTAPASPQSPPDITKGKAYWTQSGVCDSASTCACSYGSWALQESQSKAKCGADCTRATQGTDCAAKFVADQCNYAGACSIALTCQYTQQYCPAPGTVSGGTCYYGSRTCTGAGCGLSTCALAAGQRCDAVQGCLANLKASSVIVSTSSASPARNPSLNWYNSSITANINDTKGDLPISQCRHSINSDSLSSARTCSTSTALSAVTLPVGAGTTCATQGTNTCWIKVGAVDTDGVQGTSDTRLFSIDFTPPAAAASSSPSVAGASTDVTITATGSDALSGLQKIELFADSALKQTCAASPCAYTARYAGGTHSYYSVSTDNAGNKAQTSAGSISVDTAGPLVTAASNANKPYTTDFITITGTASDPSNVAKIEIFADNVLKQTCNISPASSPATCTYTQQYTAGTHSFYVIGADTLGNTNRADGTAFYVNSAPVVQPIQDIPSCKVGETVTLRCPASDADNDITAVNAWAGQCDPDNPGTPGNECFTSRAWATGTGRVYYSNAAMTNAGAGIYTLSFVVGQPNGTAIAATCQAADSNGKLSNSGDRYHLCVVGGCATPPSFSNIIVIPSPAGPVDNGGTATITFTSSAALQSNPAVTVTPAGQAPTAAAFAGRSGNDYTYRFTVTGGMASGSAQVSIAGTDTNSCSGGGLGNFNIDTAAPATTALCNSGSCARNFSRAVGVTFTAADNAGGSGVKQTLYSVDNAAEQPGASVVVSGFGTHTVRYRSLDNVNNPETQKSSTVQINQLADPAAVEMRVTVALDKTSPRVGDTVTASLRATLVDKSTGGTIMTCDPSRCNITELTIDDPGTSFTGATKDKADVDGSGRVSIRDLQIIRDFVSGGITEFPRTGTGIGDLNNDGRVDNADLTVIQNDISQRQLNNFLSQELGGTTVNIAFQNGAWQVPISTTRWQSEVTGCLEGQGAEGCGSGGYNVGLGTLAISIRYPDVEAQVVPVTNLGEPNFTRSMPIRFVATGKADNGAGSSQQCTGTDCTAFYAIVKQTDPKPDVYDPNNAVFWNGFDKGYPGNASSTPLECNIYYTLWIKMTVQSGPFAGTQAEQPFQLFVNCMPAVTVSPPEARLTVGQQNTNVFAVTFWNPTTATSNMNIAMSSSDPNGYPLQWINFVGDDDSMDFTVSPLSSQGFTVHMPLAVRSGKYPVDFTATNRDTLEKYRNTATILVFSEGLPEFQIWQLLVLIAMAPLVLWKLEIFPQQGKTRKTGKRK